MNNPECTIEWNGLSLPEWEVRFALARRASLLQSYDYARAVCPRLRMRARWGVIKIGGIEAGLVQVLEAGILRNLLHALTLDCGPVWLPGFGTAAHAGAFFNALDRTFPRRFGRRRRIIAQDLPASNGPGYRTIWLDLDPDAQTLLGALRKNWRGALNKAQKSGMPVMWDDETLPSLPWLLHAYAQDRETRKFRGADARFLRDMARIFAENRKCLVAKALLDNREVAGILILCHGKSATCQVMWASETGRKAAAPTLLLWETVMRLKQNGYRDFDLGGIHEQSAHGVTSFKNGLGGETVFYQGPCP